MLWSRFCGPVFRYELVRLSRRGSTALFVARSYYVAVLLTLLLGLYALEARPRTPLALWDALLAGFPLRQSRAASFAALFCHALLGTQFVVAVLVTPAFTAGAIGEERERRTLDFLLATDLSNREIVLGKWLAYLARPTLILLTGLPVLGVTQFLGGVEPNLILAASVATVLTMASLGAVGMLVSLYTSRPRAAILLTYGIVAGYLFGSMTSVPRTGWGAILGSGNPLLALERLENSIASGRALNDELPGVLRDYCLFHGILTFLCLWGCIRQLRRPRMLTPQDAVESLLRLHGAQPPSAIVLEAAHAKIPRTVSPRSRPEVSANPILWRELHTETGLSQMRDFFGFVLSATIWIGLMLIGLSLLLVVLNEPAFLVDWVRWVGTLVACLVVLGIALRAAGSFTRERERQTLDNLLSSPLSNRDIVNGKWLGSLLSVRRGFWCLCSIWLLGAATGCLKPYVVLVLLVTWIGHACLAASLGVFFSLHGSSTWRATIASILHLAFFWGLPALCCIPSFSPTETLMLLASLDLKGSAPRLGGNRETMHVVFVCFVCSHYLIALGYWYLTVVGFSRATGRMEGIRRRTEFTHSPKRPALPAPPTRPLC